MNTRLRAAIVAATAGISIALGTIGATTASADPWDGRSVASGSNANGKAQVTFANDSDDQWSCVAWVWDSSKKAELDQYLADWHATGYNPGVIETLGDPVGNRSVIVPARQTVTSPVWKSSSVGQGYPTDLPAGSYVGFGGCSAEGAFNTFDISGGGSTNPGTPDPGGSAWGSVGSLLP